MGQNKLNSHVMSPEAEADLKEHSGAGMALQNCLQLRERAGSFYFI